MTINLPDWARIGLTVLIKDKDCIKGDNPNNWYRKKLLLLDMTEYFIKHIIAPYILLNFQNMEKL